MIEASQIERIGSRRIGAVTHGQDGSGRQGVCHAAGHGAVSLDGRCSVVGTGRGQGHIATAGHDHVTRAGRIADTGARDAKVRRGANHVEGQGMARRINPTGQGGIGAQCVD